MGVWPRGGCSAGEYEPRIRYCRNAKRKRSGGGGKCGCEQRISYCEHEKKSGVQLGSVRVDMNRELVIVKIKKESREVKSG